MEGKGSDLSSIIEKILNWPRGHQPDIPNSVAPDNDTINYYLAPGEVLVQCPYQATHKIRTVRMARHILKCRRNYVRANEGHVDLIPCAYSDVHFIPMPELKYHENQCSERFALEEFRGIIERKHVPSVLNKFGKLADLWVWDDFTGIKSIPSRTNAHPNREEKNDEYMDFNEKISGHHYFDDHLPHVEFIKNTNDSANPSSSEHYDSVNIEEIKCETSELELGLEKVASTTNVSPVETDKTEIGYTTDEDDDDEDSQPDTDVLEFPPLPDSISVATMDKPEFCDFPNNDYNQDTDTEMDVAQFSKIPHEMMERLEDVNVNIIESDDPLQSDDDDDTDPYKMKIIKSLPKEFENELTTITRRYKIYCRV